MKYDSMIKTEYGDFLPPKGKKVADIFGANAWHSLGLKPTDTIVGEAYEIPGLLAVPRGRMGDRSAA